MIHADRDRCAQLKNLHNSKYRPVTLEQMR